jgi:hypothetical protein
MLACSWMQTRYMGRRNGVDMGDVILQLGFNGRIGSSTVVAVNLAEASRCVRRGELGKGTQGRVYDALCGRGERHTCLVLEF